MTSRGGKDKEVKRLMAVVTEEVAIWRRCQIWRLQRYWKLGFDKSFLNRSWTCVLACSQCAMQMLRQEQVVTVSYVAAHAHGCHNWKSGPTYDNKKGDVQ